MYGNEYYIYFGSSDTMPWWQRIFVPRKNLEHCGVLMQLGHQVLRVEPRAQGPEIKAFFHPDDQRIPIPAGVVAADMVLQGWTVLRYEAGKRRKVYHISNIVPSCVTLVKALIGRTTFEITPQQLYYGLLKDGAVFIDRTKAKEVIHEFGGRRTEA